MLSVATLTVVPSKSLDGVTVPSVRLLPSGAIAGDRRFALVDAEGRFVNGKRTPAIHRLRAEFDGLSLDGQFSAVTLTGPDGARRRFAGETWSADVVPYLSDYFDMAVRVIENAVTGFPDDLDSPGPTLLSTATIATVAEWFGLSVEETTRRFRANVVLTAAEPFAEDLLFGTAGAAPVLRIGAVRLIAVNPCQRCVVPTRDSRTGDVLAGFQKEFARLRQASLPEAVARDRFNHFYRLAVNTRPLPEFSGGEIHTGDAVVAGN